MIVTVTPNPAVDMTWRVPRIELGDSHRVPSGVVRAGGKGLNVARVVHGEGRAVLAITTVGGPTGAELAAELTESGLPHRLVPVAAPTRRSIALYDDAHDETTIFNELGENPGAEEWQTLTGAVAASLTDARCLVGSGSLPHGASTDFYPTLVRLASERGIPSIVDTSGPGLIEAARAGASLLKPNRHELVDATGDDDPIRAARTLLSLGAGLVLLSLGVDGMVAISTDDQSRVIRARLPHPLHGNPTGAGDAAVAASAVAIADGVTDPEQLLRAATAWSAAAVLMPLAGEISPTHPELAERLVVEHDTPPMPPATGSGAAPRPDQPSPATKSPATKES
ncbi:1-phosphofructokinase family hexose kinase [Luethyella okanaganae]|uniref:1-phosphofructokinase family hexose kinase n=1 Tax=Luethyella okanaganae TaxID=69372 RepID=A0ABW1VFU7_9MICO